MHPRQKLPQSLCLSRVVFFFFFPFGIVCYQPQVVDVNTRERVQKEKKNENKATDCRRLVNQGHWKFSHIVSITHERSSLVLLKTTSPV